MVSKGQTNKHIIFLHTKGIQIDKEQQCFGALRFTHTFVNLIIIFNLINNTIFLYSK